MLSLSVDHDHHPDHQHHKKPDQLTRNQDNLRQPNKSLLPSNPNLLIQTQTIRNNLGAVCVTSPNKQTQIKPYSNQNLTESDHTCTRFRLRYGRPFRIIGRLSIIKSVVTASPASTPDFMAPSRVGVARWSPHTNMASSTCVPLT